MTLNLQQNLKYRKIVSKLLTIYLKVTKLKQFVKN